MVSGFRSEKPRGDEGYYTISTTGVMAFTWPAKYETPAGEKAQFPLTCPIRDNAISWLMVVILALLQLGIYEFYTSTRIEPVLNGVVVHSLHTRVLLYLSCQASKTGVRAMDHSDVPIMPSSLE